MKFQPSTGLVLVVLGLAPLVWRSPGDWNAESLWLRMLRHFCLTKLFHINLDVFVSTKQSLMVNLGEMFSGSCLFSGLGCSHSFLLWREAKLLRSLNSAPSDWFISVDQMIWCFSLFLPVSSIIPPSAGYVCSFAKICSCTFSAAMVKTVVSLQQVWVISLYHVISLWTEDIEVHMLIYKETLQWGWDDHLTYTDFQSWHTWKWGAIWS